MADFILRCYVADPIEPGETVDNRVNNVKSAWWALYIHAEMMCRHPDPMIPTRIDVLTVEQAKNEETTR